MHAVRAVLACTIGLTVLGWPGASFADPHPKPSKPPADAAALVRTALEAPKHISYIGQLQTIHWGQRSATATIQQVEHLAPSSTRRTFLAPDAMYGEYDITVGATTTKIDPKQRRAVVDDNPAIDSVAENNATLALLATNYRAILGPVEIVAARPATTVALVNKFTGERTMRLWIDNQTKVVLAKERYRSDGSVAWRARYDEIRFTNSFPPALFSTVIPPGFQELAQRRFADMLASLQAAVDQLDFKIVEPHYLPDGFKEIGADISSYRGLRNLHIMYTDGIRALSLFENDSDAAADFGDVKPSITHFEGHDAQYVTTGPTTLLVWHEKGLSFALVGDLDLQELTAIAISVVP